jgi:hypothetical protein
MCRVIVPGSVVTDVMVTIGESPFLALGQSSQTEVENF